MEGARGVRARARPHAARSLDRRSSQPGIPSVTPGDAPRAGRGELAAAAWELDEDDWPPWAVDLARLVASTTGRSSRLHRGRLALYGACRLRLRAVAGSAFIDTATVLAITRAAPSRRTTAATSAWSSRHGGGPCGDRAEGLESGGGHRLDSSTRGNRIEVGLPRISLERVDGVKRKLGTRGWRRRRPRRDRDRASRP